MTSGNGADLSDMSMLDLFRMEAENHCATLTDDLLALEPEPTAADRLESLMRAAHSVKGAARIVGLDGAVRVAHAMEDVFVAAQAGKVHLNKDGIDLLLKGVDLLIAIAKLPADEVPDWLAAQAGVIESLTHDFTALARQEKPVAKPVAPAPTKEKKPPPEPAPAPTVDLSDMSMLDLFRMEAENHCATLTDDLLALEQEPTAADRLESLMRAAHSVKGAARIVGLDGAVRVAHAMEDVFVAAQTGMVHLNKDAIDLLLKGVDLLIAIAKLPAEEVPAWLTAQAGVIESLTHDFTALTRQEKPTVKPAPPPSKEKKTPPEPLPAPIVDLSDMSMLDLFRMEAENHCATLTDDLLALEQEPTAADRLESLMRAAHSVKGAARIVGLDGAVRVAHTMEDVFVAAQAGKVHLNKDGIDLLLKGVDLLIAIAKLPADEVPDWLAAQAGVIESLTHDFTALARQEKPVAKPVAPAPTKEKKPPPPEPEPKVQHAPDSSPPAPAAVQKNPGRRSEDKEGSRAIRISTENMNRLMGLAGEVLIESRWMPSFSSELVRLKMKQDELLRVLDKMNLEADERLGLTQNYIAELHKKINNCRSMLVEKLAVLEDHSRHSTEISHRLYHELIASRMRPFSEGIAGFPRMVRDLARELDKEIRLEIVGEDARVDRDIMEKIEAPLNHLIRNAIDHGIESPDEREKAGKPREAVLRLEARHRAGMLNVLVAEDGRGIDVEKIRETVVSKNMITKEVAAELNEAELMEFLFLPNFSTKKTVSKVSGRGVGLDVVHSVVSEIRGVVRASSKLHKGTIFELQLPITLSVMRALLIEIHNEPYAFPLVAIDHVLKIPNETVKTVEGRRYFTYNDKRIGLVHAQQVLGKPAVTLPDDKEMSVAVFSDRLHQYGLIVDRFWGVRDLVVQPLNPHLGKIKDISAAAILEDGTPVLIVDVEDMVRSMDLLISGDRLRRFTSSQSEATTSEKTVKRILVVDDSITVREVERKMLTAKGYEVDVAVDGMDGWNTLRRQTYDLVITDVDMPRMDGIELVTLIKQDQKLQSTPVIIVSYKDREEDKNRGLEAGADYYLTKGSFHDQTLVKAVRDLIGQAT